MNITRNYHLANNITTSLMLSMLMVSMLSASIIFIGVQIPKTATSLSAVEKLSESLLNEITLKGGSQISVLVETFGKSYDSVRTDIIKLGGSVSYEYKYINALAATLPRGGILSLAKNDNVKQIFLDETDYPSGNRPMIDGTGVKSNSYIDAVNKNVFDKRTHYNAEGGKIPPTPEADLKMPLGDLLTVSLTPGQIMQVDPTTYWNPIAMNARGVWAQGYFGQGSLAVIIDTGVYADHFMLTPLTGYPPTVIGGVDISSDVGTPYEGWSSPENHWHGTHVAGILAGHGAILVHSSDPLYKAIAQYATPPQEASSIGYPGYNIIPLTGMAPLAQIYAVKVFPHTGAGAPTSTIIAGIEYAIGLKINGTDVDVISMSLGGASVYDGRHLEDMTVDYATSLGITVSVAAGNEGPAPMTVGRPGTANTAVTSAAAANPVNTRVFWDYYYGRPGIGHQLFVSDTSQIYAFSSRGPTSDGRDKPDISSTGLDVLSAMPDASMPQGLGWASGTSMACPATSGTVALLNSYSEYNSLGASPEDYRQAIKGGAIWLPGYDKYDQGAGYLNAGNALVVLQTDTSLGDVAPPLPPTGSLMDITNIPIVGSGVYADSITDLKPGLNRDYIFAVTERTDSITLEVSNVRGNIRDPYGLNSFEVYMQSAKRTTYAYWIESANVWGNAKFVVTDYATTWSGAVSGVFYDDLTRYTIIESGYVRITVENDWTSSGPLSGDIKITVTESTPPTPSTTYTGTIAQDGMVRVPTTGYIYPPAGTTKVAVEIWWPNDWTKYPTTDLDALVRYYNGTTWIWVDPYSTGTLNDPERAVINGPVTRLYVWIIGYEIDTGVPEPWTVRLYYTS